MIVKIQINGKEESIVDGKTVRDVLQDKGINPNLVACELNLSIVKRAHLGDAVLKDGDVLEILQMIGGG